MDDQPVDKILSASELRAIDGPTAVSELLRIRTNRDALLELVERLLANCEQVRADWLVPAICGWLDTNSLGRACDTATNHLRTHHDCQLAETFFEHERLRHAGPSSSPVFHLAFPEPILAEWTAIRPLRTGQPTWPIHSLTDPQATVGGTADDPCPRCRGPVESLLELGADASTWIRLRPAVQFAWCASCSPFTEATYARVDHGGRAQLLEPEPMIEISSVYDAPPPFPAVGVGLVDLGADWRVQDWMWSNGVESMHRVGGVPAWIQREQSTACCDCDQVMQFVAQIAVEDLHNGEGVAYLQWCDHCAVTAVIYQQT